MEAQQVADTSTSTGEQKVVEETPVSKKGRRNKDKQNKRELPIGKSSGMNEGQANVFNDKDATSETIVQDDIRKGRFAYSIRTREASFRKEIDAIPEQNQGIRNKRIGFKANISHGEIAGVPTLVEGSLEDVTRKRTRDIVDKSMFNTKTLVSGITPISDTAGSKSEGHLKAQRNMHSTRDLSRSSPILTSSGMMSVSRGKKRAKTHPWQTKNDGREINMLLPRQFCTCKELPNFFFQRDLDQKALASFGGAREVLLGYSRPISQCRSHPQRLIDACISIIESEENAARVSRYLWLAI